MDYLEKNIGFVIKDTSDNTLHLGILDQETFEIEDVIMFPEATKDDIFITLGPDEISIVEIMEVEDYSIPHNYDVPFEFGTIEPQEYEDVDRLTVKELGTITHSYEEDVVDMAEILDKSPEDFDIIVLDAITNIMGE